MIDDGAMTSEPLPAGRRETAAIEVAHLVKTYKNTRAVDDISFAIARGSITGLLGGDGAGKTTTIAMIMGLVLPTSGRIEVTLMFGLMPLAYVYYPVTVLPNWLQHVAWTLPPTYVFEGMRALLMEHVFRAELMADALAINAILLAASFGAFLLLLRSARRHGSLIQTGE